jgi:hypothetical protein
MYSHSISMSEEGVIKRALRKNEGDLVADIYEVCFFI